MDRFLLKHFGIQGDNYYEEHLEDALKTSPEYALAINTGHAKEMHTYNNKEDFLQKTVLRICNIKESHDVASILADKRILLPVVQNTLGGRYLSKIAEWAQFGENNQSIIEANYGADTGFVVDKDMQIHRSKGIKIVLRKADNLKDPSCPFGFYLVTAYPAGEKAYLTEKIGTLNRYGVLDTIKDQLQTRLEQVAFLHAGDDKHVKVMLKDTKDHETRINLFYQDAAKFHHIQIDKGGHFRYQAKNLSTQKIVEQPNLKTDCPLLYKIAASISTDIRMEEREFNHRIEQGKTSNKELLQKIDDARDAIVNDYIENEDIQEEITKNKTVIQDRFSISLNKGESQKENVTLSNLNDEIETVLQESKNINVERSNVNLKDNKEHLL